MHKQAINHKQAIIGGGYLFTENACFFCYMYIYVYTEFLYKAYWRIQFTDMFRYLSIKSKQISYSYNYVKLAPRRLIAWL